MILYYFARLIISILIRLIYLIGIKGYKNIPKRGGVILVSNHGKVLDPVFLSLTTLRRLNYMGKSELFKYKRSNFFLRRLGGFPVKRNTADIGAIRTSVNILREGKILMIFPEGKVVHQEINRENMKEGTALIALMAKADIVPIRVQSTYKPFRPTKITVKEKISIDDYLAMDKKVAKKALTDEIFNRIYEIGE